MFLVCCVLIDATQQMLSMLNLISLWFYWEQQTPAAAPAVAAVEQQLKLQHFIVRIFHFFLYCCCCFSPLSLDSKTTLSSATISFIPANGLDFLFFETRVCMCLLCAIYHIWYNIGHTYYHKYNSSPLYFINKYTYIFSALLSPLWLIFFIFFEFFFCYVISFLLCYLCDK